MAEKEYLEDLDTDPLIMEYLRDMGLEYTRENYLKMLLYGLDGEEYERMKNHPEILAQLPESLKEPM
ncbi:MAG: hypothetical protein ACPKOP_03275 [Sphaerochaetaceae bacterium]